MCYVSSGVGRRWGGRRGSLQGQTAEMALLLILEMVQGTREGEALQLESTLVLGSESSCLQAAWRWRAL